ncbi:MAG: hypothetical protein HXS42_15520 [Theionarchaea archaeon]|nr:hypothetical protein [Theionarchaea archaeon]
MELLINIVYTVCFSVTVTIAAFLIKSSHRKLFSFPGFVVLLLLSASLAIMYVNWRRYAQNEQPTSPDSEVYLLIGHDTIPWSDIDHISLRRSEFGNSYVAVYFRDDNPPKGYNIEHVKDKEAFIDSLKMNTAKKGCMFKVEDN